MAINGVHHISITTEDLDGMRRFYRDVLGLEEVTAFAWEPESVVDRIIGVPRSAASMAMLRTGNCMLELIQYHAPEPARESPRRQPFNIGYTHFCLDVSDIDAEYERLSRNGMTFHAPPPPREDRNFRSIYGRDPEGNIIEIQEVFGPENPFTLDALERLNRV